ncbi:Exosome complex component RRP46 [Melipona quadrifasciata]|uniref:Exosome complex component RRP46 n=1 Tax=Melipona quadrifasciata TaxID=166423 RepID=A0A0N0BI12_9HYME|nr:Exosome complex component RRP46 [Melipona quadrifasciata]
MDTSEETPSEYILRPMNCELNQLSMPDGSAMLMQGNTAVIAGIYGPVEAKPQKMIYDKASIEVSYSPIKGPTKVDDRMTEMYIKETCEAAIIVTFHPASAICINVQELEDSGGMLGCTINAACLALINAGIPMKFTFAAVNCMIQEDSEDIILDPDSIQLQEAKAEFTFAFDSMDKNVICCYTTGCFTETEFLKAMDRCKQASQYKSCKKVCKFDITHIFVESSVLHFLRSE